MKAGKLLNATFLVVFCGLAISVLTNNAYASTTTASVTLAAAGTTLDTPLGPSSF